MLLSRCLMLACATLFLSPAAPSHAQKSRGIKPPIRGLISMGAYKFVGEGGDPDNTLKQLNKKPGIFGGIVIIATWSQLQPRPNATIGDDNVIEQALDKVRAYNRRNPQKPLAVKLRIWGGFEAPQWAKKIGGAPSARCTKASSASSSRFWLPEYRKAWAAHPAAACKAFRRRTADPRGGNHLLHVLHGRTVLHSHYRSHGDDAAAGCRI